MNLEDFDTDPEIMVIRKELAEQKVKNEEENKKNKKKALIEKLYLELKQEKSLIERPPVIDRNLGRLTKTKLLKTD